MADISLSSSGKLFEEHFAGDVSLIWDVVPYYQDRVVLNSDSVSLLPGDKKMELLLPVPSDMGYVMQSKINYRPSGEFEKAGLILKSVTNNEAILESCGDDVEHFEYAKLCIDENYILTARASIDGATWKDYGNTKIQDMNSIGFYIDEGTSVDQIDIYNCIIYKNNNVVINNFDRKTIVRIFDRSDKEITDSFILKKKNTQLVIDCTDILFPIDYLKIVVYNRDTNEVIHEGELYDIYGGDIYEYNYNVEFAIDGNILTNSVYELGEINNDEAYFILTVSNKEEYALKNKTIKVSAYTSYDLGHRLVEISEIVPNDVDDFKKELNNITFTPGESRAFKLKIDRDKKLSSLYEDYKFKIVLE